MILETERLYLRELTTNDYDDLSQILQDPQVMYAYEHAFSDDETHEWLEKQFSRYKETGHGLWAVMRKDTNEMIGQCGLTLQAVEEDTVLEIGYLFKKAFWHNGYAAEAAKGCKKYAFEVLKADKVHSIIRDTNIASQNVAKRVGMTHIKTFTKHYCNVDMPHYVFMVQKN